MQVSPQLLPLAVYVTKAAIEITADHDKANSLTQAVKSNFKVVWLMHKHAIFIVVWNLHSGNL